MTTLQISHPESYELAVAMLALVHIERVWSLLRPVCDSSSRM